MRLFGWLSFFFLVLLLLLGGYLYKYEWLPMKQAVIELEEENRELLKLLSEKEEKVPPRVEEEKVPEEVKKLVEKKGDEEGLKLELNVLDLFPKGKTRLKEEGKRVLENFLKSIRKLKYDTIEILIYKDPPRYKKKLSAKRALAIKYYFVKLGVNKNRVWAWVRREVPVGKVIIRVIKHD